MAPKVGSGGRTAGMKKRNRLNPGDVEYKVKRDRNNVAVRKSREKSRSKARETLDKVDRLKLENAKLEQKVEILSKELDVLKDLLLAHASSVREGQCVKTEVKTEEYDKPLHCAVNTDAVQKDHEYVCSAYKCEALCK